MKKYDNYTSHLKVLQKAPAQDISNEFIVSGIIDKFTKTSHTQNGTRTLKIQYFS
jgi:hypothetical protein